MPTYEYKCQSCELQFCAQARMNDPTPARAPLCSRQDCQIQKCISRVFGQVAGTHQAPHEKPQIKTIDSTAHVCSKYCDLHK